MRQYITYYNRTHLQESVEGDSAAHEHNINNKKMHRQCKGCHGFIRKGKDFCKRCSRKQHFVKRKLQSSPMKTQTSNNSNEIDKQSSTVVVSMHNFHIRIHLCEIKYNL